SSPNLSSIPFSKYLKKAVGELYGHYGKHKDIVFKLNISNEMLDISEAIPLGIIFNELLMNSMIHAFDSEPKSGERCTIKVEFYKSNEQYSLLVSDNGKGLPDSYTESRDTKTGMQLVNVLVKDHLKGKITHYNLSGTTFIVNF
ncbi:MAG: sensor histidine kinase, partial [Cyclobacteriaceae bacterium]